MEEPAADTGANEGTGNGGFGSFTLGLLVGALVGGAVAMIYAPASGEETRDVLRAKGREATNAARDTASDLTERTNTLYARSKKKFEEARSTVEDAVKEGKEAAESQRERFRSE